MLVPRRTRCRRVFSLGLLYAWASLLGAQSLRDLHLPRPAASNSVLVVGILGGFERWNDSHRGVCKVARALRALDLPDLYVATVENRRQELALDAIKQSIRPDAGLPASHQPRVILYGQSWGGAAVIHMARGLQESGIRIQLTVQVDSVGLDDWSVPANVDNAANIFQHDLFGIGGRAKIQAEDPVATRILENTQRFYLFRSYDSFNRADGSWARQVFGGSHAKMELDESVWAHVEALLLAAIRNQL